MTFVLYLTGAPAVGKTTAAASLRKEANAQVLSYGALLTERLSARVSNQDELRARSAAVITPKDVAAVDEQVHSRIDDAVARGINVVIDSHAVTAEEYGFRAVPYSANELRALKLTHIVCLTVPADMITTRISGNSAGRRRLSLHEHEAHAQLQASLALTYAHSAGAPVAFIRADRDPDNVVASIMSFLGE